MRRIKEPEVLLARYICENAVRVCILYRISASVSAVSDGALCARIHEARDALFGLRREGPDFIYSRPLSLPLHGRSMIEVCFFGNIALYDVYIVRQDWLGIQDIHRIHYGERCWKATTHDTYNINSYKFDVRNRGQDKSSVLYLSTAAASSSLFIDLSSAHNLLPQCIICMACVPSPL